MCGIWAIFGSEESVAVQCNAVHKISHRGPDSFRIENLSRLQNCCLGFHRLSIVDDLRGMQPLRLYTHPYVWLVYNGEIYNHKMLVKEFDLSVSTECDGEPIIHLYEKLGAVGMAQQLDGVFGLCVLDIVNRKVILARDTFGVRPLFRFVTSKGFLGVCSEAKGLSELSHNDADETVHIEPFPPGHVEVYDLDSEGRASLRERACFNKIGESPLYKTLVSSYDADVKENIATLLEAAVQKRLMADRRIGCLLSGGLDSSLVTALVVKGMKKMNVDYKVQTFSIGMEGSPDLIAARKVAEYLDTEHHEVIMTPEEGLDAIDEVIYHLETFDITTIRASVGMYLLSKYIKQKTDTAVILSGEGSDELAQGYIYFHKAPSAAEADAECHRLLNDLYMYDVLRGDRSTAAWGLEIRVPFLDHQFTSYYLSLEQNSRLPQKGIEKYLLRSAFEDSGLLPKDILWRPKEAFSDGISTVKRSWFSIIQDFAQEQITDAMLDKAAKLYPHCTPKTREAFFFRQIFEKHYPDRSYWIPYFWMPRWIQTDDPSARVLKHYKQ